MKRFVRWAVLAAVVMTGGAQRGFADILVSAGFNNSNYPGSYSGVEPLADSANPVAFGTANVWNALTLPYLDTPATNPDRKRSCRERV